MGIMMTKDIKDNSELDDRISADLRARAQFSQLSDVAHEEDSTYVEDTKRTSRFSWIWLVLIILAIISVVCIVFI